ncbi:MAG: helical backbone metal receptor [Phycisphaerae bacterium]|nr:helical backbone metal receptor [Phycisphaerae bacterium]
MKQKTRNLILPAIIALIVYLLFSILREPRSASVGDTVPTQYYQKIVSLAPNTTEILFALGLGDKVIGVSEFCNYPDEAKKKPRFGALMNPNYEAIAAAKPDLVIVLEEMLKPENKFAAMGIKTLGVKHNTIGDIFSSIIMIGQACGKAELANAMVNEFAEKMSAINKQPRQGKRPKVMLAVGHDMAPNPDKSPANICIAGKDDFYSTMIDIAGGLNAYAGAIPFPTVSYESIISMNPDIIIDIVSVQTKQINKQVIREQWKKFGLLDAVKNNRIYVFSEDYMAIPGPRFILTLEKIAQVVNGELKP